MTGGGERENSKIGEERGDRERYIDNRNDEVEDLEDLEDLVKMRQV